MDTHSKDKTKGKAPILGIDYGAKRVGLALSDESQTVAVPFSVLPNDRTLFREVKNIVLARGVSQIVMGDSKDFRGNDNPIMSAARAFKAELERDLGPTVVPPEGVEVFLEPEFMTTTQAARGIRDNREGDEKDREKGGTAGARPMLDASAAAIILQSFLDRLGNGRK